MTPLCIKISKFLVGIDIIPCAGDPPAGKAQPAYMVPRRRADNVDAAGSRRMVLGEVYQPFILREKPRPLFSN